MAYSNVVSEQELSPISCYNRNRNVHVVCISYILLQLIFQLKLSCEGS